MPKKLETAKLFDSAIIDFGNNFRGLISPMGQVTNAELYNLYHGLYCLTVAVRDRLDEMDERINRLEERKK